MEKSWFVIHTYAGQEDKVKATLEQRIEKMKMNMFIGEVIIPKKKVYEYKNKKRKEVEKRIYPGYVMVNMHLTDDSWFVVRNTPGVTGFIGLGNKPTPLTDKEVQNIFEQIGHGIKSKKVDFELQVGQKAKITDGPFEDFIGEITNINLEKQVVKVRLKIFGRETLVELDFAQVEEA
ncbi:MAG: transcription termination/antitermination protein NusG [Candidatus Muirbacterium halophilum]|nr:transcription termination/antitermination protein NusG [Candidatus Muirbacterium halophilum]MCK9477115.1 transcription termination/antitermination protein NusG [Candidatus Muirbacterium halophilum]